MRLQIAKRAKSLTLRMPAEIVRQLELRKGAMVAAHLTVTAGISIR